MEQEQNYISGYNQGYKLEKYSPELFDKIKDSLSNENEYERGLLEGAAEAQREKEKERMAELQSLKEEPEQERGQDNIER